MIAERIIHNGEADGKCHLFTQLADPPKCTQAARGPLYWRVALSRSTTAASQIMWVHSTML